jgi:ABC-type molybdate transport system substrate-binding protein
METNAVIQTSLLAILPMLMQGLKKIKFIDSNKEWICPLACVIASVVAAYCMELPNWFMIGITTGVGAAKIYDWGHEAKKNLSNAGLSYNRWIILLLILPAIALAGCFSDPNANLYATEKTFTTALNTTLTMKQAGKLTPEEIKHLDMLAQVANKYRIQWYEFNKAGIKTPPDVIEAFNAAIDEMIRYQATKK